MAKKENSKFKRDDLGTRMKQFYEKASSTKLMRRCPVIIRCDGKAFHTFTKNFARPFDYLFMKTMQETARYMCENIQGCVLAYTQSDEISLVLTDYESLDSEAWFDYKVQKMSSVAASMATMAFNKFFSDNVQDFGYDCCCDPTNQNFGDEVVKGREEDYARYELVYMKKLNIAMFDARVFNIPKEEVTNYIYWRQLDASRNSINMAAQALFSHKELQGKTCNDMQDMLISKGINWNDYSISSKRGTCVIREKYFKPTEDGKDIIPTCDDDIQYGVWRSRWIIDTAIPIFRGEDREYIERFI